MVESSQSDTKRNLASKGLVIWLVIIGAEIVHGILRGVFLVPRVGQFRAGQIGVFTGSMIVFAIAFLLAPWLRGARPSELLVLGSLWVVGTIGFEVLFGRFVIGLSWQRLFADYNLLAGGLMPLGLIALGMAPLLTAKLRRIV